MHPPSLTACALSLRCPRCGEGKIIGKRLTLLPECPRCGLALHRYPVADGPAQLAIWVVGIVVTALATFVELVYEPPYWVHIALWLPLIAGLSYWLLRVFKALMVALEYKHRKETFGMADENVPDADRNE